MQLPIEQVATRLQNNLGAGWKVAVEGDKLVATWMDDPAQFEQAKIALVTRYYRSFDVEVKCYQQMAAS